MLRSRGFSVVGIAGLFLVAVMCSLGLEAAGPDAEDPSDIDSHRAWVEAARHDNFFFWDRFFRRKDRASREFPQPADWYRPSELIEGGEGMRWRRAESSERTIREQSWQRARDWAFARKTDVLLVARRGVIEYEAYGEGYHAGSLLSGRSITKAVTALLVGMAVDRKFIDSLDDSVKTYLDEWRDDPRGDITIRQLLTYSSGLEMGITDGFDPKSKIVNLAEGSDVNKLALTYEQDFVPDTQMRVNNADTQLAALILERATGQRYADIASKWLWREIGAGIATVNLDGLNGDARAFCCLRARSVDLLRLGELLRNDGAWEGQQLFSRALVQKMKTPSAANPLVGLGVYLGWDAITGENLGEKAQSYVVVPQAAEFASPGVFYMLGGRSITVWVVPKEEMVVFRWGDDPEDWDNAFVVNTLLEGASSL